MRRASHVRTPDRSSLSWPVAPMMAMVVALAFILPLRTISATPASTGSVTVSPESGHQSDAFMFDGTGFVPGDLIDVRFIAPDGSEFPLYVGGVRSYLLVQPDSTFRLVVAPTVVFAGAPTGMWQAEFCTRTRSACGAVAFQITA